MATIKKAQSGITRRGMAGMKKLPSLSPKMVPGEMTGKMYRKSELDEIGRKQAAELDKVSMLGKAAMAKKKVPKAQNGKGVDSLAYYKNKASKFQDESSRMQDSSLKYGDKSRAYIDKMTPAQRKAKGASKVVNKDGSVTYKYKSGGMLKRADGSYSKRGLWDNIRANKGSGKKPTAQMLKQEKKIKAKTKK